MKEADFKPEFGNPKHIEIVKLMGELAEKEKLLKEKEKQAWGVKAAKTRVENIKSKISQAILKL